MSSAWNWCKGSDVCKMVTTVGVGVAVFAGCEAPSMGIGSVGCAVLAGAASGAVGGALDCKSGESMGGCVAKGAAIGAVTGLAGGVLGKVAATVGSKVAGAAISRLLSRGAGKSALEIVERTARSQAARGTSYLRGFMSKAEREAFDADPAKDTRFLGQAVHRATRDALKATYKDRFAYRLRGPDFLDKESGDVVELTTKPQVAPHILRPGYGPARPGFGYATYSLP